MSVPSNVIVAGGGVEQPQQHAAERRLARARLADEPDGLAGLDREVDAVDRAHVADGAPQHAALDREVLRDAGASRSGVVATRRRRGRVGTAPSARARRRGCSARRGRRSSAVSSTGDARSHSGDRVRAAGVEAAAGRHRGGGRDDARGSTPAARRPRRRLGDRREQPLGVRVLRAREQVVDRRLLDDLPGVHHDDAVAEVGDHAEVVGDEDHRHAELACSERSRSRICACTVTSSAVVGSSAMSSRGSHDERHREHRALAHATRELVRVVVEPPLGVGDADEVEQLDARVRARPTCSSCGAAGSCRRAGCRW